MALRCVLKIGSPERARRATRPASDAGIHHRRCRRSRAASADRAADARRSIYAACGAGRAEREAKREPCIAALWMASWL